MITIKNASLHPVFASLESDEEEQSVFVEVLPQQSAQVGDEDVQGTVVCTEGESFFDFTFEASLEPTKKKCVLWILRRGEGGGEGGVFIYPPSLVEEGEQEDNHFLPEEAGIPEGTPSYCLDVRVGYDETYREELIEFLMCLEEDFAVTAYERGMWNGVKILRILTAEARRLQEQIVASIRTGDDNEYEIFYNLVDARRCMTFLTDLDTRHPTGIISIEQVTNVG